MKIDKNSFTYWPQLITLTHSAAVSHIYLKLSLPVKLKNSSFWRFFRKTCIVKKGHNRRKWKQKKVLPTCGAKEFFLYSLTWKSALRRGRREKIQESNESGSFWEQGLWCHCTNYIEKSRNTYFQIVVQQVKLWLRCGYPQVVFFFFNTSA